MAHWVGILYDPTRQVVTGDSKQNVIFEIGVKAQATGKYAAHDITLPLRNAGESNAVAYGTQTDADGRPLPLAQVFRCTCGSVKRHQEQK